MASVLEIRQLRAFLALVEQGSVTAAAQALGLAQSTVSEALSSLERGVGAAVFLRRRGSHELALTVAGEALVPHARAILRSVDAAHVAVAGATKGARARVTIATNESLSTYVLAGPLDAVRRAWPKTTFEVSVLTCAGVRAGVEAGEYDLGFALQPVEDTTITTLVADRTIVADDVALVIFVQPSHPLLHAARSAPVRRETLASFPFYLTDVAGNYPALVRRFLEQDGLPGPRLQPTGSVDSVKRAVFADPCALGLLPAYALVDEMQDGRLVELRVAPRPPRMQLEALVARTRPLHPAAPQLLEALGTIDLRRRTAD